MRIQRRLTPRLSSRWAGAYDVEVWGRRRLRLDLGEVEGQGQSIYFSRVYERGTTALLSVLLRPGDWFIDVGANIGWFTTLARQLVGGRGKVWAFEPQAEAFRDLEYNISLNRQDNVEIERKAIDAQDGVIEVVRPLLGPIHGTRVRPVSADSTDVVPIRTLDGLFVRRVVARTCSRLVIKVDVEGYEPEVLAGCHALNQAASPIWIIEANPSSASRSGHTLGQVFSALAKDGYDRFFAAEMTRGVAKLAAPFVEALRPGKAFVTRPLSITDIDGQIGRSVENILCLKSKKHVLETALAERHSHWLSWLRD